jgi:hypothetical protein
MTYQAPFPRCVYILGDGLLFDDIIAHMLASVTNLRVIKQVYAGESALLTEVNEYGPDVILLTESDRYSIGQILASLSRMSLSTDLRVIVMSMKHEIVQVLERPAGQIHTRAAAQHTIQGVGAWSELVELVAGKQL